jgi:hypothetical protein
LHYFVYECGYKIAGIIAVVASWIIPRPCKETYRTNKLPTNGSYTKDEDTNLILPEDISQFVAKRCD